MMSRRTHSTLSLVAAICRAVLWPLCRRSIWLQSLASSLSRALSHYTCTTMILWSNKLCWGTFTTASIPTCHSLSIHYHSQERPTEKRNVTFSDTNCLTEIITSFAKLIYSYGPKRNKSSIDHSRTCKLLNNVMHVTIDCKKAVNKTVNVSSHWTPNTKLLIKLKCPFVVGVSH